MTANISGYTVYTALTKVILFYVTKLMDKIIFIIQAIDKYYAGILPNCWLPWIPRLLTCLARHERQHILNLLCSVGKAFPQAVYFPIMKDTLSNTENGAERKMYVCEREEGEGGRGRERERERGMNREEGEG